MSKSKPRLVKCGSNFIDPNDVASIKNVKNGKLWIIKFKSEPNPEFPCWVNSEVEINKLLKYFEVVELEDNNGKF